MQVEGLAAAVDQVRAVLVSLQDEVKAVSERCALLEVAAFPHSIAEPTVARCRGFVVVVVVFWFAVWILDGLRAGARMTTIPSLLLSSSSL